MRSKRKLVPIALATSIAAILLAVPIFTATNIINGVSIPASTNRFSMMAITGRSTKTAATAWHQLTPANPASPRSIACKRVGVNPASSHTDLPGIIPKEPLCVQLTVAGGSHYTWSSSSRTPYSALSLKAKQYLQGGGSQTMGLWPGLKLSSAGVLSGTLKWASVGSYNFTVTATGGHRRLVADLKVDVGMRPFTPSSNWAGYSVLKGPFNGVSATFNVPRATSTFCNRGAPGGYCDEAIWDGVGNSNPTSIIQAGINERVAAGTHKIIHLGAWFELYPAPNLRVNLPIHQGNRISVNIHKTVTTNLWLIRITNNTTGQTFSTLQFYTGSTSSAEWIVEAPGTKTLNLSMLTPVTFIHPQYNLATSGKVTNRTNFWLEQNKIYANASRPSPNGLFTVTSFPTASKKGHNP